MRHNYLKDITPYEEKREGANAPSMGEYLQAFLAYLGRPKTVFDFKDRSVFIILLIILIIALQKVVEMLVD